jgi:4-amino-4-deoxy-L-arabinose transferase-like glycosyltransferase
MHSDESWLSGLTRNMMQNGLNATETFFDLVPRYPHAIKSLFHIIQMPFIVVFGYNLFSVRLVSQLFGIVLLITIYKITFHISKSISKSLLITMALAFDVQFLYASHFARQEIIIATGIIIAIYYIYKEINTWSYKKDIIVGSIIGILIGVHPNSFIVALTVGSIYIYYLTIDKKIKIKNALLLIGTVGLFASLFIALSFIMDNNFINNYLAYGSHLGVKSSLAEKILNIIPFYKKLFLQISGTYYTPFIIIQLVVFGVAFLFSIVRAYYDRKVLLFLFPIIAVNVGYIIIGRYSQPSIFLLFPLCYMLVFYLIITTIKNHHIVSLIRMSVFMLLVSIVMIVPYLNNDYNEYLSGIKKHVSQDSKVLANLNSDYAFDNGCLFDYRNLEYLDENNMSFKQYIRKNDIEYIIYPEEMDFIYEKRPVWNIVYGNIYPYYEDMQKFFVEECELVNEFNSPYGMRIVQFSQNKKWNIKIYKVNKD